MTEIGRGGFAVVYRAADEQFNRTVAVKTLLGSLGGEDRERFERECRAMGVVSRHPHCVTVYASGFTDDGRAYLVMEDMTGGAISRRQPMPWADAIEVGVKVAGALQAAHAAGVLHRDLKPDNILVSAYEEPKLGDFGIARLDDGFRSRTGVLTATPAYAAPELFAGHPASEATDVYALAATLFTLVAGNPPFAREGDESVLPMMHRILHDPVPDLRPLGVADPVGRALEAGLERDPARRISTALEFGHRLQAAQRETGREPTRMVGVGAPTTVVPERYETVVVPPPAAVTSGFWFYVDAPEPLVSGYDYSQIVSVLQPGQWYLAGEQGPDWVYAADGNGAEGWVPTDAVRHYES
jgi:serine/threonine-protein kinase PknK